ncbi:MAG: MBL fold metallo-hydrolase [Desulfobulbaceae bacterium]|nr:MBL fold metallo-hydrolase [Desulfobulbaceae bacterium]
MSNLLRILLLSVSCVSVTLFLPFLSKSDDISVVKEVTSLESPILIRFWGTRGSIPTPGKETTKYGGNTLCVEIRLKENNRLIIIDAGSGIRELGKKVVSEDIPIGNNTFDLFLTHTHWDHIQGFPFFSPLYLSQVKLRVFGPVQYENDLLENIVGSQMTYRYFPVSASELAADIKYYNLKQGTYDLGDNIVLRTIYLNHTISCLGYRFEYNGKVICTVFDHQPFSNLFTTDPNDPMYDEQMVRDGEQVKKEQNKAVEDFIADADLVIFDAPYTQKQYEEDSKSHDHSPIEYAIAVARKQRVKKLAMLHHSPDSKDHLLDSYARKLSKQDSDSKLDAFFAEEGMEIEL